MAQAFATTPALERGPLNGVGTGLPGLHNGAPAAPPGLVPRERLVGRLMDGRHRPVALVLAPAGYGKTSLLSEWAVRDPRPFAWVTLTAEENDPARLLSAIALALDGVEPIGWEVFEALSSARRDAVAVALQRLARALSRKERPLVLVLDDLHLLHARGSRPALQRIWRALPPGSQLALASRTDTVLPVGRLRADRSSVELRAEDLAMTPSEAAGLLGAAGLAMAPKEILGLVRRTEGWPAGLYLAALSLRAQEGARDARVFAGDDRFLTEYVREELLSGVGDEQLEFLLRTSVLGHMSGPLCDAVLGREDSAARLESLAHANVPLVVLDRGSTAYRYNELFAEVLRSELRRIEPGREQWVHRRASARLEKQGDTDRAVRHAIDANDLHRAGRLLWGCALERTSQGNDALIRTTLEGLTDEQVVETPLLALVAASGCLARGNLYEADRWTTIAAGHPDALSSRRRTDLVEAGVAIMRAGIGRHGIRRSGLDAARAHALLAEHSPWRPLCRFFEGAALHLTGDRERARMLLEEGAHRAAVSAPMVQALCLAQLALLMAEDEDPERGTALVARARAQVERWHLRDCPQAALVFAVSAALRVQRGPGLEAAADLRHAVDLLSRFTDPSPWFEAECRIVLAGAALRLSGPAAAAELLAQAATTLRRTPDAEALVAPMEEARSVIEVAAASGAGADWCLTAAELRVLRHLPSHLSFREIADCLYVSPNTVKTHARAIYRKLGVSSRGRAVDRARGAGLVGSLAGG